MIYFLLITAWCLFLWVTTRNYTPVVDDIVLWSKPTARQLVSRLYGAHAVNNLAGDRAISVGLHWIMSCLVALAINPVAGLMFCVHPTTLQVAVWLNGKRFAVAGILAMMAFASPFALALLPLILLFQPIGIPAFLFVFKHNISFWYVFIGIPFIPFCIRHIISRIKSRDKDNVNTELQLFRVKKVIFAVKSLWVYFRQSVLPDKNVMYYNDYYGVGISSEGKKQMYALDFAFWAGMVAMVFIAFHVKQGWWLWLLFAVQWFNFVTITQTFADRYMYIALVGACWYLSGTPIAIALIGFYMARSIENLRQYDGLINFLKYNIEKSPKNPSASYFLSGIWLGDGRFDADALVTAKDAIVNTPNSCLSNMIYARCLYKFNNKKAAVEYMEKALSLSIEDRPEMAKNIKAEIAKMGAS